MNNEEIEKAYKDYVNDMIEYENEIVDNIESFPEITNDIYNTKLTTKAYIKKVKPNAKIPKRGSDNAAGYDLYACTDTDIVAINPHETKMIDTGIAITPPNGYFGAIFARSGLSIKEGLRPANCVGVCDNDYTGSYIVALHNDTNIVKKIHNGDRIAQLVFLPYINNLEFIEVDELEKTDRADNGFGSTGKQ
jgi:dUTP pyrophosphatase